MRKIMFSACDTSKVGISKPQEGQPQSMDTEVVLPINGEIPIDGLNEQKLCFFPLRILLAVSDSIL